MVLTSPRKSAQGRSSRKPKVGVDILDLKPRHMVAAFDAREGVALGTRPSIQVIGMALGWNGCRGVRRKMARLECDRREIDLTKIRLVYVPDEVSR